MGLFIYIKISKIMKKLLNLTVLSIAFLMMFSNVYAAEKITIETGDFKETYFEITNGNKVGLWYNLYTVGWRPWIVFTYSQIYIEPGQTERIKIILAPGMEMPDGTYEVNLIAESKIDTLTKEIEVTLKRGKPAVKEFIFKKDLLNIYLESASELEAEVIIYKNGEIFYTVNQDVVLGGNYISRDLDLLEGDYIARLNYYYNDKLVGFEERKLFVPVPYRESNIIENKADWNYFIVTGSKVVFENVGNGSGQKEYSVQIEKTYDPFFNSKDYSEKTEIGENFKYVWNFELNPRETYQIDYSYNYTIILLLTLAVVIFLLMVYKSYKRDLDVKKFFSKRIGILKEDKEIKIGIEITNRTPKEMYSLVIEDTVQPIFELKKEFQGVKPEKIIKMGPKEKLIWKIPKIGPKESIIVSYLIVPRIGVNEVYIFPTSKVKYRKDELLKTATSNQLKTEGR